MECDLEELKATKNREKTADEMFEELGYEDSPCGYGAKRYKGRNYYITFYKNQIRIVPREVDDDIILNFKELQAINKKVEELRMKVEKCEYCQKRKILNSCNFCGSAKMIVSGDMLDIYGDENKFNIFKRIYRPRFIINFCPMCR